MAYYRSDDKGATWLQINDEAHGFGPVTSVVLAGDPRIYGRYGSFSFFMHTVLDQSNCA
jgi:hypothetical protein